ncbi:MAG: AMP-binding protein [Pseudomonadota bacterium]
MNQAELEKSLAPYGEAFILKFQEHAAARGDKVFFYYGEEDRSYSYDEFNRLANCFAGNLLDLGVQKGDRVALFTLNPLVSTLAMFGLWKAGAVFCPINYNYKGKLLAYHINDAAPKILIVEQALIPAVNQVEADLPALPVIIHRPLPQDHDFNAEADGGRLAEKFTARIFKDLLTGNDANPGVPLSGSDTASIIYTSGTTGDPKGVVQPHRYLHNYVFPFLNLAHPDDVVYNDLPLYHVGGAFANVVRAAWAGCRVAVWDKFSPREFWPRVKQSGANCCILLDVMIPWLMMMEPTPEDAANPMKMVHMQPLPQNHHEFARRFGVDLITIGYGSTESGAVFAGGIDEFGDGRGTPEHLWKGHSKERLIEITKKFGMPIVSGLEEVRKGFMGRPSPLLETRVLDEQGREVPVGAPGQLAVKSRLPHLMIKEYFNKPEATAKALQDGWFLSGDVVVGDEDGLYRFFDRLGGFIRVRGENMSSHTVEGLLCANPAIGSAAVFPVPAAQGNEEDIAAFIVLKPGAALGEDELRAWMEKEMPKYMRPRHLRFVAALPVTPTFKVQKYLLKSIIQQELGR